MELFQITLLVLTHITLEGQVKYTINNTSYFNLYALQVHLQYSVDVHISSCIELIVK